MADPSTKRSTEGSASFLAPGGFRREPHPVARSIGVTSLPAIFCAICSIPLAAGATVCVDDFVWITNAWSRKTLGESLVAAWPENFFYRPIDIVANRLVNPMSLELGPVLVIQLVGLLLLTAGMWRLLAILRAAGAAPRVAATAWLWLHPATQLSVWSAGASSQTWSAALGIWTICVVLERCSTMLNWRVIIGLFALSASGVIAKELYLGWATAAAFAIVVGRYRAADGAGSSPGLPATIAAMCAALLPPIVWIVARLLSTRFGDLLGNESGNLYAFQGPLTILKNACIAALGLFAQGPIHWARLLGMPWCLVPFFGAGLSLAFAYEGSRQAVGFPAGVSRYGVLPYFLALAILSIWPALCIAHVSELYVLGPNALVAALVGIGVASSPGASSRSKPISVAALFLIAAAGFASRAYHFTVTWAQARELRAAAHETAACMSPHMPKAIVIPAVLRSGPMHSKYCVPPAVAAALNQSWSVERLVNPRLPDVQFVDQVPADLPPSAVKSLDVHPCRRAMW